MSATTAARRAANSCCDCACNRAGTSSRDETRRLITNPPSRNSARSADEHGDEIQHEADEAAHQRAVDADELQIAADLDLDLSRGVGRVPSLHGASDELGHLGPILIYHAQHQPFHGVVDVLP